MFFVSRLSFCVIALCLVTPALPRIHSLGSTAISIQSSDEATLRALTEDYCRAVAEGGLDRIRQLWNPQSPNLAARLRSYRIQFLEERTEFISPTVTRLEITDDHAVTHLTSDERRLDKKTGAVLYTADPFHGACRSFEWTRTGAGWKIEREMLVQDDLAAKLDAAASEQERRDILEKESVFVTDTLVRSLAVRGIRQHERGEFDTAIRIYRLQEEVAERIGDTAGAGMALAYIGVVNGAQRDYQHGLPRLEKVLALFESMGLKLGVALVSERLSRLYRGLGDNRKAFDRAEMSLRLYEEMKHRRGIATALSQLSNIFGEQNNDQQALGYLERALPIAQELGDAILVATIRHDIAIQYKDMGEYEKAFEIYQGLLNQTTGSGDVGGAAMIKNQVGNILSHQGRYDEAMDYHRQALEVRRDIVTLNNISGVYLAQRKYSEALPFAEEAVSRSRYAGTKLNLWWALSDLGKSHLGLNHLPEAQQAFAEAIAIIEKLRTQTAGDDRERQRYFEGGLRAHHGMLKLLVQQQRSREALVFAERAKARVLLDVLQHGRASVHKAMTAEEQEMESRLKWELTQLNVELGRATQADRRDEKRIAQIEPRLEKARLNYEAFQNSLYAAHPELKVQRGEAPVISAEELTDLLASDTSALLEYAVTDDKTYLFAITKDSTKAEVEVQVYTLAITRGDLAKQIQAFRRQLARRDLAFRAPALKLNQLLLEPAAAQLRGKTDFIIAADDTLWDLPFQALLDNANRFLIEKAAISYAPSLTVLREMMRQRRQHIENVPSSTLLALGNPRVVTETSSRASLRDETLGPLPEAEQEVIALRRLYGASRSKVYIGAEAREDVVKREASRARIIHFATHGTLNNALPMYSHLALALGNTNEDGLLEAWELMQLDLNAELVVLSACETARGRIGAGEGMIGLSWAMFIAGVPSTVVSQWKVEAASTRDLMLRFHRGMISSPANGNVRSTKAAALRRAAITLMSDPQTRHPFYWAGFVLVGEGR